ncbi:unnamed protein product [Phytomonas sp. Hart1]|nr:unnamed protein product [Phytomonas sp. Hart1]|eukprot:CCW69401.1 unnamed protein product [Phytomonas sp. isolate Hart1]
MECSVFSPCGRYLVRFRSDGKTRLDLEVRPKQFAAQASVVKLSTEHGGESISTATESLFASLDEIQVQELTTAAGVRKSLKIFSEMMYRALIGRTSCVKFYVERCDEMKRRIGLDIRRRHQRQPHDSSAPQDDLKEGEVADEVNTTLNLSLNSDIAEDILSQSFFTMDYDVDFTRAVFPIPLGPVREGIPTSDSNPQSRALTATTCGQSTAGGSTTGGPTNPRKGPSASSSSRASSPGVLEGRLKEALHALEKARGTNHKLRRENETLIQLSKEKMLEMQRLCEDFQSHVGATAELEKLRGKNTELRMKLRLAEEERDAARDALEKGRGEPSRGLHRRGSNSCASPRRRSGSSGGGAPHLVRPRGGGRPALTLPPPPLHDQGEGEGEGGRRPRRTAERVAALPERPASAVKIDLVSVGRPPPRDARAFSMSDSTARPQSAANFDRHFNLPSKDMTVVALHRVARYFANLPVYTLFLITQRVYKKFGVLRSGGCAIGYTLLLKFIELAADKKEPDLLKIFT